MKKETENLIYSLQSGLCASRGSIDEAYKELQEIIKDELPQEVRGVVHLYVQILLNSIVAEVMTTEHKVEHKQPTEGKKEYISKEDYVPASILSASDYELRTIVSVDLHTSNYKALCKKELVRRQSTEWAAPWADAEKKGVTL